MMSGRIMDGWRNIGKTDRRMDSWMDRWLGKEMNAYMDDWKGGEKNGWMDER